MADEGLDTTSSAESSRTAYWSAYLRIGFAIVVMVSMAALAYLWVTRSEGNRPVLTAMAAGTACLAAGIFVVAGRVAAYMWRAQFSLAAGIISGLILTVFCVLDGGVDSPLAFLLVLPVLNAAIMLPRWAIVWIGTFTVAEVVVLITTDANVTSEAGHLVALTTGVASAVALAVSITFVRTRLEVTEQANRAALLRAAQTDMLTGCLNQRAFARRLAAELGRFLRYQVPFSLAVLDVDLFKAYNDSFGHSAGDEALAELGRTLCVNSRPSDIVARVGGDEFAVILPNTDLPDAAGAARRLAAVVNDGGRHLTVSIGVAKVSDTEPDAKHVYRHADTALYEAKARGRATVVVDGLDISSTSRTTDDHPGRAADRKLLEWRIGQSERERREVMARMQAVLAAAPLGVSLVGPDLRIQMINRTVVQDAERAPATFLGRTLEEAFPDLWPQLETPYQHVLRTALGTTFEGTSESSSVPGGIQYWHSTLFPVMDDGRVTAVGNIVTDVTDRRLLEQSTEHLVSTVAAALATTVEVRDPYTSGHQARVAAIAEAIAEELGLDERTRHDIALAATVHDIGKISVPAEMLSRPGRLSDAQMALVKEHARIGHDILMSVEFPEPLCRMVLQHHERIDGSGYPDALAGHEICTGAKVIAVADVVDAMASMRPYREALGFDRALSEIETGAGIRYDDAAAAACLRLHRQGRLLPSPEGTVVCHRQGDASMT